MADLVLLIHALVVVFIIGGAAYIWAGARRGWPGVRSPLLRYLHLVLMLFVAAEALVGMVCPLTLWEDALRGETSRSGFVARWLARLIYYDLPAWVFTTAYVVFAVALIITLILVPPRSAQRDRRRQHQRQ